LIGMDEPPVIDTSGPELVYVQVANHLAGQIESGRLAPGARLPAERSLAEYYGVAYDTIRRAMQELRKRELIVTVHGRGTYVARRLHG
jgi:DNA-binding GntR family transcriptional regulator